jgi:putative DNA primase/helicase
MSSPIVKKFNQSIADIFIQGLKDGTSQWLKPWDAGSIPPVSYNPVSGAQYRGGNQMALMFAEFGLDKTDRNPLGDRRWMTYKQAASIGAQVRRGEKSQMLVAWKELEDKRQDQGKGKSQERGNEAGHDEEARRRMVAFPFFVFHATQIDGLPPPQVFQHRPMDERLAQAQQIVDDLGVPVLPGASFAAYVPSKDRILMPEREAFRDDPSWMATLLHECSHATGHESRLNRKFGTDRQSEDYAREELRAEMSSFDMCRRLGVPFDPGQHIAYVNNWISLLEKDPAEIMRAAADSERILKFLKVPEIEIEKIPVIEKAKEQVNEVEREQEQVAAMPDLQEEAAGARARPPKRRGREQVLTL